MMYHPETKARALAQYKREITAALAWYDERVAAIWVAFGRPAVSAECQAGLSATWTAYVAMLRRASEKFTDGLTYSAFVAAWNNAAEASEAQQRNEYHARRFLQAEALHQ